MKPAIKNDDHAISKMITALFGVLMIMSLMSREASAQPVPSPKEHFGFNIGDDYMLATYTQTEAYFKKLAASDRAKLVDIGMTEEGRHQYMLIVSSAENIKNLQKYKDISARLAHAEGLTKEQAETLARDGKAVVWIDGGLHATEVVGSHQLIETAWQLVTRTDNETLDILNNVIVLLVCANPDGHELVSSWYMKDSDTLKRRSNIPRLYQKYAGHDNNRDFYMLTQKETKNMSTQLYIEWFPQVLYNHHQSGPAGSVLAGPPYRDPFNYVYDPLVITSIDALGAAMNNRLNAEGKTGYTMKSGASFSTWYNGGLRTTSYFHNITGLLTEIIGNPTPSEIPLVPDRLLPSGSTPNPVTPQKWHFSQSIDYSVSLNYAVIDYASRYKSELLFNIWRMGMNSIEKGSRDNWTVSPKVIADIRKARDDDRNTPVQATERQGESPYRSMSGIPVKYYDQVMKDPLRRDARIYIVPADQNDFPTAVKFINALIGSGVQVHKATAPFTINGKNYPQGSFVIKTAQAFRPYIIDLFEPQDHPNDLQYPGGPPIPPYDAAGWTLAFQMGVSFNRITDGAEGPFEKIPYGELQPFPAFAVAPAKAGYILSTKVNNSFIAVNSLLKNGVQVYRITSNGTGQGDFFVPASARAQKLLSEAAPLTGIKVTGVNQKPSGTERIYPTRIAIVNRYGGSMPAGWISWMLEQFSFSYKMIYPQSLDSGNLKKRFDVIVFTSGSMGSVRRGDDSASPQRQSVNEDIPAEFRGWTGNISNDRSVPEIKKFLEQGGTVVTIGPGTNLAYALSLPVESALTKKDENGNNLSLRNTEFYIPGSLLLADVAVTEPAAWGMPERCDVNFDSSPVFRFKEGAEKSGVRKLLWFSNETPLHSGWALGQNYLKDGVAAFMAPVGKGNFYAFGPEITFRSQPHGTFKLLFNQLYMRTQVK
jgi:hypothetical protein